MAATPDQPASDQLILNARLVNEGLERDADVRLRAGRIEAIGSGLGPRAGERVIDARGRWLLPGMIDDQVHFREPGLTHKGDIATESAAAVAGGITSYMEMPNTRPPAVDRDSLEHKFGLAQGRSRANYSFYLGATNDNIDAIRALDPRRSCGLKVFMGASTGNMLVDDPATLEAIFRDAPGIVITHCEDTPTIEANQARLTAELGDHVPVERHPDIRSREACLKSSTLAVALARRHGTRLHVLHISTADELALFEPGPVAGKRITAETCVHYLHFDRRDYATLGNLIKCNPAIKDPADRQALIRGLAEDRIDVLATDHAPHTLQEKQQPYLQAPSGLPLVQFALVAALELVHEGHVSLPHMVEKVSHAPARLFGITGRGFVREGAHADLVLVDPDAPFTVERSRVLSRCGWSPFEGRRFRSRVDMTWVNGVLVYLDGELTGAIPGRPLEFTGVP
ncbi:MAG TPA: dihydroorotase [Xanthomonadaceae bacterium]|nr:dihydroorotase [Xanthomonadaceae bacterium]